MATKKTVECPECKSEVAKDNLDKHMRKIHGEGKEVVQKQPGERRQVTGVKKPPMVASQYQPVVALVAIAIIVIAAYAMYPMIAGNVNNGDGEIEMETSQAEMIVLYNNGTEGRIVIELFDDEVPQTVSNFKRYVRDQYYDGTIFHRVIDGFMIQGGGFVRDGAGNIAPKDGLYGPIPLEIKPNLRHLDGSLSMARTSDPNSATSQFFINDGPQANLEPNDNSEGYAVFGRVLSGMEHVRNISAVSTHDGEAGYDDVPDNDVQIVRIRLLQ